MKQPLSDRLYNLLPSVYRLRDHHQGEPLRAFLALLENELLDLEADIDQLYDNWFIETCEEWVIPYLGDLLKVNSLHTVASDHPTGTSLYSQRAYVANTLAYRQGKGTVAILEQLARDVTNWPAKAVELFQRLNTTQYLNHVRLDNLQALDLRNPEPLGRIGGPFEIANHTIDVRRIASNRGKYNIPNVGIFLWRLQSYPLQKVTARPAQNPPEGRYWFNPLGQNLKLFNPPQTERDITHLAEEINVPAPLRRSPLQQALNAIRAGQRSASAYFETPAVFEIFIDGQKIPIRQIYIRNLEQEPWPCPSSDGQVWVDPELGRLSISRSFLGSTGSNPPIQQRVQVSYSYGFSADIGGGPYSRYESVFAWYQSLAQKTDLWRVRVERDRFTIEGDSLATPSDNPLVAAIEAWNLHANSQGRAVGIIAISNNGTYQTNDLTIQIPAGGQLAIVAADWPEVEKTVDGHIQFGELVPVNLRPYLQGNLAIEGMSSSDSQLLPGKAILNGLLVEGSLTVPGAGNLGELQVAHSTLVPTLGGMKVNEGIGNRQLSVQLDHAICGPIEVPDTVKGLQVVDSIVDGKQSGSAIRSPRAADHPGPPATLERSTFWGTVTTQTLTASEVIFTEPVMIQRRQLGCVRFSYIPPGSETPRQYRCLSGNGMFPHFTSTQYSHPAYGQLASTCPQEILTGAEDESEIGVFSLLKQPQREANLRIALDEYLPFGLEAGIFYIT